MGGEECGGRWCGDANGGRNGPEVELPRAEAPAQEGGDTLPRSSAAAHDRERHERGNEPNDQERVDVEASVAQSSRGRARRSTLDKRDLAEPSAYYVPSRFPAPFPPRRGPNATQGPVAVSAHTFPQPNPSNSLLLAPLSPPALLSQFTCP